MILIIWKYLLKLKMELLQREILSLTQNKTVLMNTKEEYEPSNNNQELGNILSMGMLYIYVFK